MIISEQEKNRILNLHTNSIDINGTLIMETKNDVKYVIQVGVWGKDLNDLTKQKISQAEKEGFKINRVHDKGKLYKYILDKKFNSLQDSDLALWTIRELWFEDAFKYKTCNGKRIGMEQECSGDVATEKDTDAINITLSDSLPELKTTFDPNKESKVYKCTMDGCAAYVRSTLDQYQGNAWHAHRLNDNMVHSAYKSNFGKLKNVQKTIEKEFTDINRGGKGNLGVISSWSKHLVPDQQKFKDLKIDDVVGLYYAPSSKHAVSFFESMTGYDDMGKGSKAGDGPFMVKKDGSGQWAPSDLGKDIPFKYGKTLESGTGPGLNTHLGFVGAIHNGEPIIFHNIHKQVWATPLSEMSKDKTAIMWAKRGKGTSGEEVYFDSKVDEVKQTFTNLYNKWFN